MSNPDTPQPPPKPAPEPAPGPQPEPGSVPQPPNEFEKETPHPSKQQPIS